MTYYLIKHSSPIWFCSNNLVVGFSAALVLSLYHISADIIWKHLGAVVLSYERLEDKGNYKSETRMERL